MVVVDFVLVSQRLRILTAGACIQIPLGEGQAFAQPGCTFVDPDDRSGRKSQWLREQ